jgi:hypothetical protein
MPELPDDEPIRVVPDWVCEILSPTTRRHDMLRKLPYYAKVGVPFMWLVAIDARVLTAHRLDSSDWRIIGTYSDETEVRIAPFDSVPLNVADWWPPRKDPTQANSRSAGHGWCPESISSGHHPARQAVSYFQDQPGREVPGSPRFSRARPLFLWSKFAHFQVSRRLSLPMSDLRYSLSHEDPVSRTCTGAHLTKTSRSAGSFTRRPQVGVGSKSTSTAGRLTNETR